MFIFKQNESYSYLTDRKANENETNEGGPKRLTYPNGRSVCNMYLKVDPFLYQQVYENEGNSNDQMTITYLLFFLNKHVEFLNDVYGKLKFYDQNKNFYYQGLTFMIHRTKVLL